MYASNHFVHACTRRSRTSREARKGVDEDVIDDTDKSIEQQANDRCRKPLSKRGQGGINVHVGIGTVAH
jgi:hypothetical protein